MADGTEKPIDQVRVGDKVLATDPVTGEQVAKEVTHVWVHDDTLTNLVVDGETITTTEDHPFFDVTDGDFEWASQIDPGDQILTDTGHLVTVHGMDTTSSHQGLAYNLTVDGIHTYHVGTLHVLVHNTSVDECPLVPGANNALRNRLTGRFAPNPNKPVPAPKSSTHRNSRNSPVLTYLYRLEDTSGNFLKWGITNNLRDRYTQDFMRDKVMTPVAQGSRSAMMDLEREAIEYMPGPMNYESWGGKALL